MPKHNHIQQSSITRHTSAESGFSLIGVLVIVVTMAIATSIALETITPALENKLRIETEASLEALGHGIAGDYSLGASMSGANFGYVGDIGALPVSLTDLKTNPGGYVTWNGPYLRDEFTEATNKSITDSWGTSFNYLGGVTVTSSGSGSPINYSIAQVSADLLDCGFSGAIVGANGALPGSSSANLIAIVSYPDGLGSIKSDTASANPQGQFSFNSGLPIGIRYILVKDTITADSISSFSKLLPRSNSSNTTAGTLRLPITNY